jgi:protein-S-isoprenylcysteine O-methyltransferase Ste14
VTPDERASASRASLHHHQDEALRALRRKTRQAGGAVVRSGHRAWAILLVLGVHTALLAVPIALVGRVHRLTEARSLGCGALLLALSILEPAAHGWRVDGGRGNTLSLVSGVSLLATAWLAIGTGVDHSMAWLGSLVSIAGIALRCFAIRELGPGFTSTIEPGFGRRLVVAGIYGRVRHPSDLGLLLVGSGIGLLGGSLSAGLVVLVGIVPSILLRIREEERALSAQFGTAHRAYLRSVGALFPRLRRG